MLFFENGDVAATGQFSFDKPVGTGLNFINLVKRRERSNILSRHLI